MKIEKLPSGSYRVRKMVNGQKMSLTFESKPSEKDVEEEIKQRLGYDYHGKMNIESACLSYIDARSNTLSPSTIREYRKMLKQFSEPFKRIEIDKVTTFEVQTEINKVAVNHSPKTVRNYHGLIASVLAEFRPELVLHTHLPMLEKKEPHIPSQEEIRLLLEHAKGTRYYVPILLGCASMRRGEICALEESDIEGNIIHITKDMVLNDSRQWIVKAPKTTESIRDIYVPDEVIQAIQENGLYKGHPNKITEWMELKEKEIGLPQFSLHKCRHYFASVAHEKGISDADIMKAGGWKTEHVMKSIYRHSMSKDNSHVSSAVFDDLF